MKRRRGSLVRRFQMLLLGWGVLICGIAITGFWFATNSIIQSNFEQQAIEWVERVDDVSSDLFLTRNSSEYSEIEQYLKNFSEISYVRFYRPNGMSLIADYESSGFDKGSVPPLAGNEFDAYSVQDLLAGKAQLSALGTRGNLFRVIAPVVSRQGRQPAVVGYIDLGINFTSYKNHLTGNILVAVILISILFFVAAVVGRQLITNALKPLLDLQEPLHRLARGEMDVWVSREGDEEIVAISRALNSTINAIKGRDRELRRLADYDALTGMINKRSFNILLEKECQRVTAEADGSALFFIDLDQFKYINDTLGHAAGDRLLVQIADLLRSRMRVDDIVCRLGGDEFAVLAKSVDREGAIEIANSIIKSMYDFLFVEQGKAFNIYCSIGVALLEQDGGAADDVLARADMACYNAKSQGRNRFNFYQPDDMERDKVDIGWSHRIANALSNDKFILHFQPIVDIEDQSRPNFEVLLRMRGEDGEVILPNMFIPVAERFGLATEIDYWVIKNSMLRLESLNRLGKRARFYVNLSGQLLEDPDFVERVLSMFGQVNIDAGQIVFELTERAAIGNLTSASEKMEILREHGFLFAVDDFGSGFSSFSYLRYLPVEFVKIEGEFVERIIDDEVDRAMVKSMVDIAKACGKQVVAEYVGNQKTLDMLKSFGIDYAQGFFIAAPTAEPAFHLSTGGRHSLNFISGTA